MSQPVSCEASRTFWPRRPIASDSCWSGTTTSMRSRVLVEHHLGDFGRRQRVDHEGGESGDHGMMSIFSPCSSLTTACTREPRMPTQAPTGSTEESREITAILAREPGSRATAFTSTMPS